MKRPAREDVEAHREWLVGVVARLHSAWRRHPLLVLRALRWFIRSDHHRGVQLAKRYWYFPMNEVKSLLVRLMNAWRGAYGCTCDSVICSCGHMPQLLKDVDPDLSKAVRWIRDNPERS